MLGRVFAYSVALGLGLLCSVGCGGSKRVPFEGIVTLDGKPLAGAKVMLQRSEGPIEERFFSGDTDANGHFAIKPPESDSPGVAPGDYRVLISSVQVPPDANEMTRLPKERVPTQYRDGSVTLTVPEEGNLNSDFALKSR
jgi:hypothetical protein